MGAGIRTCENCGRDITGAHKLARYCKDIECQRERKRDKFNKRYAEKEKKPPRVVTCYHCGETFTTRSRVQEFCNKRPCRNAYRKDLNRSRRSKRFRIAVCPVCNKSFTTRSVFSECRSCQAETGQRTYADLPPPRARMPAQFPEDGFPRKAWKIARDDLTEAEQVSIDMVADSVCYSCIHLRACGHQVRESARLHKLLATKCGF
jgi:hypothetical protein